MVEEVGAFRLFRHARIDPFYADMAVPHRRSDDWPSELARLWSRVANPPLVEFAVERWPGLAAAVGRSGELAVLMVLDHPPEPVAVVNQRSMLLSAASSRSGLAAYLRRVAQFQGGHSGDVEGEIDLVVEALSDGWLHEAIDGDLESPLGGARLLGRPPIAELAAVWSDPDFRRQGLARARCAGLLHDFFARGGRLVWLGAATQEARELYRQLGFVAIGSHISWRLQLV